MDKRAAVRFDKAFPVSISSEVFGESTAVARNISAGGIMLEVRDPLPLGTEVRVHFSMPDSPAEIVARGEVKNHYFFNFSDGQGTAHALMGMGIRFLEFENDGDTRLGIGLARMRSLH
ncbi:MAG: PilZ domain-containing protein [Myxococcales bacterium]|nr:PilZ domain-containing protein [Myxococcota bacterium]MDW8282145.1 PilZ domain-containing protein [Myxococcales bacterium]